MVHALVWAAEVNRLPRGKSGYGQRFPISSCAITRQLVPFVFVVVVSGLTVGTRTPPRRGEPAERVRAGGARAADDAAPQGRGALPPLLMFEGIALPPF